MGLPQGFQPRPCQFCGSRHVINFEVEQGIFKVTCTFCGGQGPNGMKTNDDAWLAWNGQALKAPGSLGAPSEVLL